jgi:hypothetical protein
MDRARWNNKHAGVFARICAERLAGASRMTVYVIVQLKMNDRAAL